MSNQIIGLMNGESGINSCNSSIRHEMNKTDII